jgi:hypothetical protein
MPTLTRLGFLGARGTGGAIPRQPPPNPTLFDKLLLSTGFYLLKSDLGRILITPPSPALLLSTGDYLLTSALLKVALTNLSAPLSNSAVLLLSTGDRLLLSDGLRFVRIAPLTP